MSDLDLLIRAWMLIGVLVMVGTLEFPIHLMNLPWGVVRLMGFMLCHMLIWPVHVVRWAASWVQRK